MKKIFTLAFAVNLSLALLQKASAQNCVPAAGGNGVSTSTPAAIVIDGNMADWAPFLNDPDNNVHDNTNGNDLDAPIADVGRDLVKFTFTQNPNNLFIYIQRAGSSNNSVDAIFYADINNNGQMEYREPVIQINWNGANGTVTAEVHDYIPFTGNSSANNVMLNGDGASLKGTLSPRTSIGNTGKGSADGKSAEIKIPFSFLKTLNIAGAVTSQLTFGADFKFHISTINGNVSSIPNINSINDNFGGCLIAPKLILPVKLNNFTGSKNKDNVQLQWNVSFNEIAYTYEVERSTDGKNFETALVLFGTEKEGSETYSYSEVNEDAKVYYRLRMTDKTNTVSYSKVLVFNSAAHNSKPLYIVSNVVNDILTFSFQSASNSRADIRITDMYGRNVAQQSLNANKGNNLASISLPGGMNSGMYIAILSADNVNSTAKFVKQ